MHDVVTTGHETVNIDHYKSSKSSVYVRLIELFNRLPFDLWPISDWWSVLFDQYCLFYITHSGETGEDQSNLIILISTCQYWNVNFKSMVYLSLRLALLRDSLLQWGVSTSLTALTDLPRKVIYIYIYKDRHIVMKHYLHDISG